MAESNNSPKKNARRNLAWSQDEDRVLRAYGETVPDYALVKKLNGRTQQAIVARRFVLGIKKNPGWHTHTTMRKWSAAEERLLLERWEQDYSIFELSTALHRTEASVASHLETFRQTGTLKAKPLSRRRALRVPRSLAKTVLELRAKHHTYAQICQLLGIANHELVRRIVRRYRKPGRPWQPKKPDMRTKIVALYSRGLRPMEIVRRLAISKLPVSQSYVYRICAEKP